MKELIKKILREMSEESDLQRCSSNKEITDVLKSFTLFRTGMCNQKNVKPNTKEYRVNLCGTFFTKSDQGVPLDQACTQIILDEYNDDNIRWYFNTYMEFKPYCNVFKPNTCEDIKMMSSKSVNKIPTINSQMSELNPMKQIQVPTTQKNQSLLDKTKDIVGKTIYNVRKKFE